MTIEKTPLSAHAGMKRGHSPSTSEHQKPHKRQKVRHGLPRIQERPADIEPAPQGQIFAQGQLLRSLCAALSLAGFDSVKPSALEMFRSHVEEYMLHFLARARMSMRHGRRATATALDFAAALAAAPNTSTASLLTAQLDLRVSEHVAYPSIRGPDPAPTPAPDFASLLAPLITQTPQTWIPKHFPALPPSHAWKSTPDFPKREKDARKMREKATEEGMLAEQALRKLAAAAKTSAMNAEKRRNSVLSGEGKIREKRNLKGPRPRVYEDTFADVLKDISGPDEAMDLDGGGAPGAAGTAVDLGMPEGIAVNHNMAHWRKGASNRR